MSLRKFTREQLVFDLALFERLQMKMKNKILILKFQKKSCNRSSFLYQAYIYECIMEFYNVIIAESIIDFYQNANFLNSLLFWTLKKEEKNKHHFKCKLCTKIKDWFFCLTHISVKLSWKRISKHFFWFIMFVF